MQLAYHHALRTINDEGTLRRHQGDFAHVHLLFLSAFLFSQLECDVQRRAVRLSLTLGFESRQFRLANVIMAEIEHRFLVVAFDRENLLKNSLESLIFSLGIRGVLLEEIDVRVGLNLNQIWRFNAFLNGSKVDAFG